MSAGIQKQKLIRHRRSTSSIQINDEMNTTNEVLVSDPHMATPTETPFDALRQFLQGRSGISVLQHVLGVAPIPGAPDILSKAILNALDCENWERNQTILTEIGITAANSTELRAGCNNRGASRENLLKQLYFYHYRMIPHAHLRNNRYCYGDPTANRFGQTRFVNVDEARDALEQIFNWPLDPSQPELGLCPVIFIGHAVSNDVLILRRTLAVETRAFDAIVMTIDTQILAQEVGLAPHGRQTKLSSLAAAQGFECRDAHNAGNDAAYTMFTALLMALPKEHLSCPVPMDQDETVQSIIDRVEVNSRRQDPRPVGIARYCERCGSHSHFKKRCRTFVSCKICADAGKATRIVNCHRTETCQSMFS